MKQLIKPFIKKGIENSIIDALCTENSCGCTCGDINGNGSKNASTTSDNDILF